MPKQQREKDRQSQTGRDRKVSKDGAGGKYTWGSPGMEDMQDITMTPMDPNFSADD